MLLQYIHIILLPHDAIYFVKCTSPSCSKAPPQHDAATDVLHSWYGVLRLASLPLYPPNITMVIMAKQFYFCFIRGRSLFPCTVANRSLAFLWQFWSNGFFLAERPFRLCQNRSCFTVDIDTFVPVSTCIFTRSFAAVLGLICTFRTKVHSSLGDRMCLLPERYDGFVPWSHGVYTCVLLFVQMNVVPSGVWKLLPRMNQTCEGLQFYLSSWLISFDFPMMSSKV